MPARKQWKESRLNFRFGGKSFLKMKLIGGKKINNAVFIFRFYFLFTDSAKGF
jgi:hypothetical protein